MLEEREEKRLGKRENRWQRQSRGQRKHEGRRQDGCWRGGFALPGTEQCHDTEMANDALGMETLVKRGGGAKQSRGKQGEREKWNEEGSA